MSVIFSAAMTGLGHVAHAAVSIAENLSRTSLLFEMSQDGETVWGDCAEYSFAGFSEDGDFSTSVGADDVSVGRRLGRLKYDSDSTVWQLCTGNGEYIMIKSCVDTAEIFCRVR